MSEWKPGDVAVLRFLNSDGPEFIGICTTPRGNWRTEEHGSTFDVVPLRRLAVIDPEDAGQAGRLAHLYDSKAFSENSASDMQEALREFLHPIPPEIEEPTLHGAVVEAACTCYESPLRLFVRDEKAWKGGDKPWQARCGSHPWEKLSVNRVLSPGVKADS